MDNSQRPAEELWRRTLAQIPTVFGRLNYLASLRNRDSGCYEHHGLSLLFGPEESSDALQGSHTACFREWLCMDLEQQKADLGLYLTGVPTERRTLLENWLRMAPYRNLLPAAASAAEKDLFLGELETLLRLLSFERGAGPGHRGA
jgi:hypothetical protein